MTAAHLIRLAVYAVVVGALWVSLGCEPTQRPERPAILSPDREWKIYLMVGGPAVYCARVEQVVLFRVGNSIALTTSFANCP